MSLPRGVESASDKSRLSPGWRRGPSLRVSPFLTKPLRRIIPIIANLFASVGFAYLLSQAGALKGEALTILVTVTGQMNKLNMQMLENYRLNN
jgi:hypothetical protein